MLKTARKSVNERPKSFSSFFSPGGATSQYTFNENKLNSYDLDTSQQSLLHYRMLDIRYTRKQALLPKAP